MGLLNLVKGSILDLSKEATELKKMMIGLGWDTRCDLDSIAFLTDEAGRIKDTVCYMDKRSKGIYLNGDNLTGAGDGDDECIFVTFDELPGWVNKIQICVNIFGAGGLFNKKDFSNVKGAFVRLVDSSNDSEVCRYNLTEDGKGYNAFHFADLVKDDNGNWAFVAIGQGMNGSIEKLRNQLTK